MKETISKFRSNIRFNTLIFMAFITCLVLIYSSYAWFSATLDVKLNNFRAVVDPETGIYISLDGVNWGSTVEITKENIITNLEKTYPGHTNQWSNGMTSVSTIGQSTITDDKFSMFGNKTPFIGRIIAKNKTEIDIVKLNEDKPNDDADFIAFDIFIKNLTTSPYSDNLYLVDGTKVVNASDIADDTAANAIRLGMLFMGSVHKNSPVDVIQNITCDPICKQYIYEPNSTIHNESSIKILKKHNYEIVNGEEYPTYGVFRSQDNVQIWSGIENSLVPLNVNVFQFQKTTKTLNGPIGQIASGINKIRVYIWVEGQDIDIIEQKSTGYEVSVIMNFEKDMAGYE